MIWLVAENQQLCVNTVVWMSAVINSDSSQTAAPLSSLCTNFGKHGKLVGSTNIWKTEQSFSCQVPVGSTACPLG